MTAKQAPLGMAECPQCDPCCPELDEDGRPYACYFCCDTGWIEQAVADEYRQRKPVTTWHLADDDLPF